jgi:hypothetical protein
MPKKIPLQDAVSIRGGDSSTIPQAGYNGYIPPEAITALSWELNGLVHGTATLTIHIRDGKMARFTTGRERSFMGDGNGE